MQTQGGEGLPGCHGGYVSHPMLMPPDFSRSSASNLGGFRCCNTTGDLQPWLLAGVTGHDA